MRVTIRPLTVADVDAMRAWRYDPPYERYDVDADPSDVDLMLTAAAAGEGWYAAEDVQTQELVGFFEFVIDGEEIEVGLGLRPDLTGRGLGAGFLEQGSYCRVRWAPPRSRSTSTTGTCARSARTSAPGSCAGRYTCGGSPTGTRRSSSRMSRPA